MEHLPPAIGQPINCACLPDRQADGTSFWRNEVNQQYPSEPALPTGQAGFGRQGIRCVAVDIKRLPRSMGTFGAEIIW